MPFGKEVTAEENKARRFVVFCFLKRSDPVEHAAQIAAPVMPCEALATGVVETLPARL
jgi:hypothetical protein